MLRGSCSTGSNSTPSTSRATSAGSSGARRATPFPQRTIDLLKQVDAALFGAITSKPVKEADAELAPASAGEGAQLPLADRAHAAVVRPVRLPPPVQGLSGQPAEFQGGDRPGGVPREHRGSVRRRGVPSVAGRGPRRARELLAGVQGLSGRRGRRPTPCPARSTPAEAASGSSAPRSSSRASTAARE